MPLAEHFLKTSGEACGRIVERIAAPAKELLEQYGWPGNIRELAQCIDKAVHAGEGAVLRAAQLPEELQEARGGEILPIQ